MQRKRWYNSFLIRSWAFSTGEHRIRIEHVQSHARVQVTNLAAAMEWMCDKMASLPTEGESVRKPADVGSQAITSSQGQHADEIVTLDAEKGLEQ
jgi:hypothetical protein